MRLCFVSNLFIGLTGKSIDELSLLTPNNITNGVNNIAIDRCYDQPLLLV